MSDRSKSRKLLNNEWVKTGIMLAIVLVAFFTIWFGIRFALATDYPLLAVASGSMQPTLNIGDLIVVQGVSNASQIYTHFAIVNLTTGKITGGGDIIVFHTWLPTITLSNGSKIPGTNLRPGYPDELIVHRAVSKFYDNSTGVWYFMSKGDANPFGQGLESAESTISDGWQIPFSYIVGKVVGDIPYVGGVPLFIRTPTGILTVIILIILVLFAELTYSTYKEKRKPPTGAES